MRKDSSLLIVALCLIASVPARSYEVLSQREAVTPARSDIVPILRLPMRQWLYWTNCKRETERESVLTITKWLARRVRVVTNSSLILVSFNYRDGATSLWITSDAAFHITGLCVEYHDTLCVGLHTDTPFIVSLNSIDSHTDPAYNNNSLALS